MPKPNQYSIQFLLEAPDFKSLVSLMLKNNLNENAFYDYDTREPQFKGDTWKAIYYRNVENLQILKGKPNG